MNPQTVQKLHPLVQANPALLSQLQTTTYAVDTASVISRSALASGVQVDAVNITEFLSSSLEAQITGAKLDQVAGGAVDTKFFCQSSLGGWPARELLPPQQSAHALQEQR